MDISYNTRELRDLCELQESARQTFGSSVAQKLQNRLSDIDAADSIFDVILGKPTQVQIDNDVCYRLTLGNGIFLVISANHVNNPLDKQDNVDWKKVSRVKVKSISGENYE